MFVLFYIIILAHVIAGIKSECCNSIVLKGGNLVASHILKDKLGTYEFQSENANTESFYVLLRNSTFSSIVFGDGGKGWRLYNGIETNPNAAGSGLISFGCSERCPTDCASSNFGYYNRNIEDFDIDPSLKLECLDDRLKRSSDSRFFQIGSLSMELSAIIIIAIVAVGVLISTLVCWRMKKLKKSETQHLSVTIHNRSNEFRLIISMQ